jgi:signal-transduction protein with cAMP-binding, CBS, and nucleotidyltransferase domain
MQTIAEIMSTDVLTVQHTATLGQVARSMRQWNVGSAIVLDDGGKVAGVISERELVESVARSRNPDVGTAQSWMKTDFVMVSPEMAIPDAVEAMRVSGVRHLTVGHEGNLAGVVSIRDLLASVV